MIQGLVFVVVAWCATFAGIWGFSQIVGTLQSLRVFGPLRSLFLLVLWGGILYAAFRLVAGFLPRMSTAVLIGYGISLLMVLREGKIR